MKLPVDCVRVWPTPVAVEILFVASSSRSLIEVVFLITRRTPTIARLVIVAATRTPIIVVVISAPAARPVVVWTFVEIEVRLAVALLRTRRNWGQNRAPFA
jgi:hypothetical protein